jgi:hypothetical protein
MFAGWIPPKHQVVTTLLVMVGDVLRLHWVLLNKKEKWFAPCIGLERPLDGGFHFQFSTLSDWGQHAKHVDRSLRAYTPAPSNPSSLGALVQP